jgi:hypothetical protein
MSSKQDLSEKTTKELVKSIVESYYKIGLLNDNDIKDSASIRKALKKIISTGGIGGMVIDHRDTLLKNAEYHLSKNNFDLAKVFYATFFEHFANSIIDIYCYRNKIDEKSKKEIIRCTSLDSKLSWLLMLFGFPKIKDDYFTIIRKLSDDRNAYIHYKWSANPDFDLEPSDLIAKDQKIRQEFIEIKKVIRYIKVYESRISYKGKKEKIKKNIK